MKLSQQKPEPIPYEEKFGYQNSLETDHWSDVMKLKNGKFYKLDKLVPLEHGNKEQIELLETANRYADEGVLPEVTVRQIVSLEFWCICGACNDFQTEPFDIDDDPQIAVPGQIYHCHNCDLEYVVFRDDIDGLMLRLLTKKDS